MGTVLSYRLEFCRVVCLEMELKCRKICTDSCPVLLYRAEIFEVVELNLKIHMGGGHFRPPLKVFIVFVSAVDLDGICDVTAC